MCARAMRPIRYVLLVLALVSALVSPPAATAQPCAANVPHTQGQWSTRPYLMSINPISATLMHDGRVLIVAGSENDATNYTAGAFRNAVWDPTGSTQDAIEFFDVTYDVFCAGVATLGDGRPLAVGGTSDYSFTGESRASIFDPVTDGFVQTKGMADGRWYATATVLGDGRVMAFSGLRSNGSTNRSVEIFDPGSASTPWTSPSTAAPFTPPLFPRMFLLPNGRVFYTGQGSGSRTSNS